jgi:hypothetical protein
MKRCAKCKGDLAGLAKFAKKMAEFEGFAKKCASEVQEIISAGEFQKLKPQQEQLRQLLVEMEKWLKMPNFKSIICQQIFTNSYSVGGNYRRIEKSEKEEEEKVEEIRDSDDDEEPVLC